MEKYDIFISYRRDGGDAVAGRISDKLTSKGYKVFFDVESMRSGDFNEQIYEAIDLCSDMIVVLPQGGLDRCESEKDWVRLEIAHAIKKKKNIIPVMLRNFSFPPTLPDDINYLRRLQGVVASMEYFDATVSRMESLLVCNKKESVPSKNDMLPKNKIKISRFLRTPVHQNVYKFFLDMNLLTAWWELFTSEDFPEDVEEIIDLISGAIKKYGAEKKEFPYFVISDYYNDGHMRVPADDEDKRRMMIVSRIILWRQLYSRINDISFVPKRYKDDSVDVCELMNEISELSQTCFYNDAALFNGQSVAEMVYLGKKLIGDYPRKNEFSFYHVIDFCFKCCVNEEAIREEFELWDERISDIYSEFTEKRLLDKVSCLIQDSTEQYGLYEDMNQLVNTRVKLFLKFYQLVSMFLTPGEKKEEMILKHLLINYKYLKKNNVILTKDNEELYEKLVNVYSEL